MYKKKECTIIFTRKQFTCLVFSLTSMYLRVRFSIREPDRKTDFKVLTSLGFFFLSQPFAEFLFLRQRSSLKSTRVIFLRKIVREMEVFQIRIDVKGCEKEAKPLTSGLFDRLIFKLPIRCSLNFFSRKKGK